MSEKPREGVYLDAALAVVGEQIEERIDQLSHRRAVRRRMGGGALAAATLLSGAIAAAALSGAFPGAQPEAAAPVDWGQPAQLRCVEGADAEALAFFTAEYRVPEGTTVDAAAVCSGARAMIKGDARLLGEASPEQLVVLAESVLRVALVEDEVAVSDASFGRVSPEVLPFARTCVAGDDAVVQFGVSQASWEPCAGAGE